MSWTTARHLRPEGSPWDDWTRIPLFVGGVEGRVSVVRSRLSMAANMGINNIFFLYIARYREFILLFILTIDCDLVYVRTELM